MECAAVGGDFRRLHASLRGLEREAHATLHRAICDACGSLILGTRFRCADCADFDLCRGCLGCPEEHFARSARQQQQQQKDSPPHFLWTADDGAAAAAAAAAGSSLLHIHTRHHRLLILNRVDEESGQWAIHLNLLQRLGKGSRLSIDPRPAQLAPNGLQEEENCGKWEWERERASVGALGSNGGGAAEGNHNTQSATSVTIRALRRADLAALLAIENICFLQPYPRSAFERAVMRCCTGLEEDKKDGVTDDDDDDEDEDDDMCMDEDLAFRRCVCFVAVGAGGQHAPPARVSKLVGDGDGDGDNGQGRGAQRSPPTRPTAAAVDNVGEKAGVVAGYILLVNAGRPSAQVASIATRPDCRGRGVASALLRHAMDVASRAGSSWCDLHVHVANAGAQRLYTQLGFCRVQKLLEYYGPCEDGMQQSGDAFHMRRRLSPRVNTGTMMMMPQRDGSEKHRSRDR